MQCASGQRAKAGANRRTDARSDNAADRAAYHRERRRHDVANVAPKIFRRDWL
jgi:hypothetical protein